MRRDLGEMGDISEFIMIDISVYLDNHIQPVRISTIEQKSGLFLKR